MSLQKYLKALRGALISGSIGVLIYTILLVLLGVFSFPLILLGLNLTIDEKTLATLITILLTISIAVYIYEVSRLNQKEDEIRKQFDLLIVLSEELDFLKSNLKAYEDTFSKKNNYPLYELWEIDTSLYFANLNHKINNEETIELKKNLMKIKDKIIIINNSKAEARKIKEERDSKDILNKIDAPEMIRENIKKIINNEIIPLVEKSKKIVENIKTSKNT